MSKAEPGGQISRAAQNRVLFCVALADFVYEVETNSVDIAIPVIRQAFDLTTSQVSFVSLVYLLLDAMVLLTVSWAARRWNISRVFCLACLCMAAGAACCALSPDFVWLLGGRVLQGIGAGAVSALCYAIIPVYLPADRVGWRYSWLSTMAGLGMIVGAPVGGFLTEAVSWRGVFGFTAVLLLFLALCVYRWLPAAPSAADARQRFDWQGAVLFACGLTTGINGLSWGQELGWASGETWLLAAVSAACFGLAFRRREGCEPLFPAALLCNAPYRAGLAITFAIVACVEGSRFLLPLYLNSVYQAHVGFVSLALAVFSAAYVAGARLSRRLAVRLDDYVLVRGVAVAGAGVCGLFAMKLTTVGIPGVYGFCLLLGLTAGMLIPITNAFLMKQVTAEHHTEAGVIISLVAGIGSLVGVSSFETAFSFPFPGGNAYLSGQWPVAEMLYEGGRNAFLLGGLLLLAAVSVLSLAGGRQRVRSR